MPCHGCTIRRNARLACAHPEWPALELLTDFQLQIEHALDLRTKQRVLFVDASVSCAAPFAVAAISPERDKSFSSHALSPQALLQVYRDVDGEDPPPSQLLAIRGERFELGEGLSAQASHHLDAALEWTANWLVAT